MSTKRQKREPITKLIRFEVFKRDKFQCQYCGQSAPQALLQVDHINPVANGGSNDITNLITACFDCNNGKGARLIDDDTAVAKQKRQLDQLQERREQLEMMMEWHQGLRSLEDDIALKLKNYWDSLTPGFALNETGMSNLKKVISNFGVDEILKAMDVAARQYLQWDKDVVTRESCELAFSKIAGICRVEKLSSSDPDIKQLFYIRGIIKNRLSY